MGFDFASVPQALPRAVVCTFPSVDSPSLLAAMHDVATLGCLPVPFWMSAIWQTPLPFALLSEEGDGFACHQAHKHTHCAGLAVRPAPPS